MKKLTTALSLALICAFITFTTSCKKEPILVVIDLDGEEFCIPANTVQPPEGIKNQFDVSKQEVLQAFEKAGLTFTEARLEDVKVVSFGIESKNNVIFKNEIIGAQLYAKPKGALGDDGIQVAYTDELAVNESTTNLNLSISGKSLKELFLNNEAVTFTVVVFNKPNGNNPFCFVVKGGKLELKVKK
jgi:hypothetical protein